jgi:hypothetical protein
MKLAMHCPSLNIFGTFFPSRAAAGGVAHAAACW